MSVAVCITFKLSSNCVSFDVTFYVCSIHPHIAYTTDKVVYVLLIQMCTCFIYCKNCVR